VLLDEESETLGVKLARGISNAFIKSYHRPIGSGVAAKLIWSNQPVFIPQVDPASPEYRELRLENDFASLICVPIIVGDRGVGYMHLERASGEPYTSADLRYAQLVANLAAAAKVMDELRRQNEQLSFVDPVTQALKYHAFLRALVRELERARLHGVRMAVGLLDLDNFRPYGEIHGLKAGYAVLTEVAGIVRAHIKGVDLVGRFGLDDLIFAVLKIGDRENARELFESIRAAVEAYGRSCGPPHPLASIGGLFIEPNQVVEDFAGMLHQLRHALHAARDRGGNQVYFVED
jgi:diguanylate cyclase (GGDEF)-like protein